MTQEAYVSFETAKLLKEKGFNEQCRAAYTNYGKLFTTQIQQYITNILCSKGKLWECTAPTYQMACAWLRDVYHTFIEISTSIDLNGNYHFSYTILDKKCKYVRRGYTDFDWNYEDAVESAIKYCLENLI